ncbi:hypothetical protein BBO99_00006466 [Phytophthora kernoviae]|uniref:Cytochrome b-c1 complex subunit 7 n=1 Tax=Phytophthora kernoviae TaxID=325452 RepID=A0A421F7A3_9STRA|nr:hypothetical protein JM16_006555 [Phytophthora kernoviae]RLN26712.1 hypothetical protein BBI17_006934 [Phytophthora kernoviae]RLN77794.1 hypothetical protein BBO99_00006466 [Phytophthora kernoviae]
MSLISKVAGLYQKSVSKSFGMYGLKYDDALVDTAAVQTALHWVTGEDYQSRTKRIARAADCSLKRSYLPDEIQAIQRPLDFYMSDKVVEAEKLAEERADLTRCNEDKYKQRSAAAISIAYLRAAAEKKKSRDREFARELFREETEFRKKITVKIEQANKMMTVLGSSKSFNVMSDSNIERAARFLQEEDGEGSKKMSCRWFLDRSFYCVTPGNQMTHFYRHGRVDECKTTWKNMYLCYRSSMMNEDKREEFLKDTPLDASKPSHVADVWEQKETPGW